MVNYKAEYRKEVLERRCSLTDGQVRSKSARIIEKLITMAWFYKSHVIMCYVDFRNEVMTRDFMNQCLQKGKKLAVPRVFNTSEGKKEMKAYEITDLEKDLVQGCFGVLEPRVELCREVKPLEIDLVIVPGVAFDMNRNRMGYGAGYYDRFLKEVRADCVKAGIAFECQLSSKIPTEEHDIPLDVILTEDRLI